MALSVSGRRRFCRGLLAGGVLAGALSPWQMALAQPAPVKAPLTLAEVNRMDEAAFVAAFGNTYELSPWVAKAAFAKRPFPTVTALHQALADAFRTAPREQQLAFFHKLSDIGDRTVKAQNITAASKLEQSVSGVDSLTETTDDVSKSWRSGCSQARQIIVGTVAHTLTCSRSISSNAASGVKRPSIMTIRMPPINPTTRPEWQPETWKRGEVNSATG